MLPVINSTELDELHQPTNQPTNHQKQTRSNQSFYFRQQMNTLIHNHIYERVWDTANATHFLGEKKQQLTIWNTIKAAIKTSIRLWSNAIPLPFDAIRRPFDN